MRWRGGRGAIRWGLGVSMVGLGVVSLECDPPTFSTHVVCIGDSITVGVGASSPAESYVATLQGIMGRETHVEGFGHSGATALGPGVGDLPYESQPEYAAATQFIDEAGPDARVAVVLMLGTNDSKPANWDKGKDRFSVDYARLASHFAGLATHPTVYVALPPATGKDPCCTIRGDVIEKEIDPALTRLAKEKGFDLIDLGPVTRGHDELLVDGVHPNDKGYEALARAVDNAVVADPPRPQRPLPLWRRLPFLH